MIFRGNGIYGDIEVNSKEEAIDKILYMLNNFQCGWGVVYVHDLLKEFKLKKDDFKFYSLSAYYGAYQVYYKPRYTEEELEKFRRKHENEYATDLIQNLSREIEECVKLGMTYDYIQKYFNLHDLVQATKVTSKFLQEAGKETSNQTEWW